MVILWAFHFSVVILALNPPKSGQIANKGFMIYYGRYRSQLAILESPKQNSCSNLLNWRIVSPPGVHNVIKKWSDGISLLQAANFSNVFSNCQRTIPGWLTLFYISPFSQNGEIRGWQQYALAIMLKIIWIRMFGGSRILNITKKNHLKRFLQL